MITSDKRQELIQKFRTTETDSGSPQVQIAILTARINGINEHMKQNKKDFSSQRGLLKLVGQRNRLLKYLRRTSEGDYKTLIGELGLRK